jgi:hypothetical protein
MKIFKPISSTRILLSQLINLILVQNYLFIVGSDYDVACFEGKHMEMPKDSSEVIRPDVLPSKEKKEEGGESGNMEEDKTKDVDDTGDVDNFDEGPSIS